MNKLIYILLASVFLSVAGCSKIAVEQIEKPAESISFLKFRRAQVNIPAVADSVMVTVDWSLKQWELSYDANGFITALSVKNGGDKDVYGSFTSVLVKLKPNFTNKSRSQDLLLKDMVSGQQVSMKIIQDSVRAADKLTINRDTSFQKVIGFGGMLNPAAWGTALMTEQDIDKLYGSNGLGFNIIRTMIYPDPANWSRDVALAKRAQGLGAIVFSSPWTPPASMKSNNVTHNTNGDSLRPDKFADFAAHLKSFVDYQKGQGVNIHAVSVQNEPDYRVSYDGCTYSPQALLRFVRDFGHLVGDVKLIASETVQYNLAYTDPLLNDATARGKLHIIGTHLYGGGNKDYPLARQYGKEIWMTEHLFNSETNGPDWAWIPSIRSTIAKEIHDCMVNNFNAYVWWYLKRYYSMLGDDDARSPVGQGQLTKRAYIMSHYAKYATGRTRIGVNVPASSDILATVYKGTNDMTAVLINRSEVPVMVELASPVAISQASAVETNNVKNMEAAENYISDDKKSVKIRISGNSIVSVKLVP